MLRNSICGLAILLMLSCGFGLAFADEEHKGSGEGIRDGSCESYMVEDAANLLLASDNGKTKAKKKNGPCVNKAVEDSANQLLAGEKKGEDSGDKIRDRIKDC